MLFVLFSLFFHSTEEKKGHVAIHSTYLTMYDSNIANAAFKYLSSFVRFRIIFMCVWLLSQGELTVPKCETFHILHSALCRTACINLKHWNSASSPFSIRTIKYTFLLPKHHEWRDGDRINISSGDKRAHCTLHWHTENACRKNDSNPITKTVHEKSFSKYSKHLSIWVASPSQMPFKNINTIFCRTFCAPHWRNYVFIPLICQIFTENSIFQRANLASTKPFCLLALICGSVCVCLYVAVFFFLKLLSSLRCVESMNV